MANRVSCRACAPRRVAWVMPLQAFHPGQSYRDAREGDTFHFLPV